MGSSLEFRLGCALLEHTFPSARANYKKYRKLCSSLHFDEAPLGPRARFRQTVHQIFSNALDVLSFFVIFSCLRSMVDGFLKFLQVAKLPKMQKSTDISLNFMVFEGPK